MVIVSVGPTCFSDDAKGRVSSLAGKACLLLASADKGSKLSATTAFGMTDTIRGSKEARSTVFSLLNDSKKKFVSYELRTDLV